MSESFGTSIAAVQARISSDAQALSLPDIQPAGGKSTSDNPASSSFVSGFKQVIEAVNQQDHQAGEKMAAVDAGKSDDLVGAMLASQQAGLSFSMLMQARNKIVGALDELIKLQL